MARRAALVVPALGLGSYVAWRCLDEEKRRRASAQALAARRAWRAGVCSAELILRYKWLSWRHGGEAPEAHEARRSALHRRCALRALELCRANGGLFTKLGQHAATLRPAVPDEYAEVLAQLQDRAPARPLAEVGAAVCAELRLPPGVGLTGKASPFDEFDAEPVGSASLAQVHRARLHTGTEVAVKVQHSDIEAIVASDLHMVRWLEWLASLAFKENGFSLAWAIDELSSNVARELNFLLEADNAERCREFFSRHPTLAERVVVPGMHRPFCTSRLLIMDFSRGVPVTAICEAAQKGEVQAQKVADSIARCLVEAFGAMVFSFGFVHCDPHPGNLLVLMPSPKAEDTHKPKGTADAGKPSQEPRLVLLDHGLYRELSESSRLANCGLWTSMVLQDAAGVAKHCAAMGIDEQTAGLLPLYFTNRSSSTKAGLGQPITEAQKAELRDQLARSGLLGGGGTSTVSFGGLNALADRLPGDMLFVMRTMHLVASLHRSLGGTSADRFFLYAMAAAAGRWEIAYSKAPAGPAAPLALLLAAGRRAAQRLDRALLALRLGFLELLLRLSRSLDGCSGEAREQFSFARALAESGSVG